MFSQSQKNGIEYLHSGLLNHCDFLVHAFGTRLGGVSRDDYKSLNMSFLEGDEEFRVLQNWDKLASAFEIPMENFLVLNQVHGDNIFVIKPHGDYFSSREALNYDAIVTNRMNLAICIKTADCVPVFLVDRVKKIIGAAHAGWRGSALGISAKVVRLMQNTYGSRPADILAAIGPSIGRCCYEIDAAAADAFRRQENSGVFLSPGKRQERWMLDLVEVNRRQLLSCGIPETNIDAAGICTVCRQDIFFSHRGSGGVTGRQINFMMIKGDEFFKALLVNGVSEGVH
ncbi:MAG: peptidoglycan editing factor PgeF, partial [Smithellaceae bacterium]|jgi:YfiH family protein|nr:peptidoglycan editing factor PgeF [Smithellaceae bacterium]